MSLSIYYVGRREWPLSTNERATLDELVSRYAVEDRIEEYLRTGEGFNWESFRVYGSTGSGVIFEGATKLPDNGPEAAWTGLQHRCRLLSEIRRELPETSWRVQVEDHDILWDPERGEYDPSV